MLGIQTCCISLNRRGAKSSFDLGASYSGNKIKKQAVLPGQASVAEKLFRLIDVNLEVKYNYLNQRNHLEILQVRRTALCYRYQPKPSSLSKSSKWTTLVQPYRI